MLYQIAADKCQSVPDRMVPHIGRRYTLARPVLERLPYHDFTIFGSIQKDIEDSIAENILGCLHAVQSVWPIFDTDIFKTRHRHTTADIYTLNSQGDLVIYELRRGAAGEQSVYHSLALMERANQWDYTTLEQRYRSWSEDKNASLATDHAEAFEFYLKEKLSDSQFNRAQHLTVIGSAADKELASEIDYWKDKGVSIEFLPYRIYTIAGQHYFELFNPPYDRHYNPAVMKGVMFDTSRDYNETAIWNMMERSTIEAYGDKKRAVCELAPGDIVFYSHKGHGIVAAAKVKQGDPKQPDEDTLAREVEFLTAIPRRGEPIMAMPFEKVEEVTAKRFCWRHKIPGPSLSRSEADELVEELKAYLAE